MNVSDCVTKTFLLSSLLSAAVCMQCQKGKHSIHLVEVRPQRPVKRQ